jgi:hypothetical protein
MFIEKEERLSRASPFRPARGAAGRPGRWAGRWQKLVRRLLYLLLGLLGGLAVLAGATLFLGSHEPTRPATPGAPAAATAPDTAAGRANPAPSAVLPPAPVTPPAPSLLQQPPAAATTPDAASATPAEAQPPADAAALAALQQQIREATDALAGLRSEAERLRREITSVPAGRPTPSAPAPKAAAPPPPAPEAADAGWADAERTIQALSRQPSASPATPSETASAAPAVPRPPAPATAAPAEPVVMPAVPLARVFLHYRGGSVAGMQVATEIARRLVNSSFAYGDTRSAATMPPMPVIRYFHPADAAAAQQLASLLDDTGLSFRIEDATARPGHFPPGTLDVWVGR